MDEPLAMNRRGFEIEDRGEAIAYVEYSNNEKIFELIISKSKGNHIILTSLDDINRRFGSNFNNRDLGFDITPEQLYQETPAKLIQLRNLLLAVIRDTQRIDYSLHKEKYKERREEKNEEKYMEEPVVVKEKPKNNARKIRMLDMTMRDLSVVKYLLLFLVILTVTLIALSVPSVTRPNRTRKEIRSGDTGDIYYA